MASTTSLCMGRCGFSASHRSMNREMALRAAARSHELVEQICYRTREGMKTAVRKGKSAGGLAYGYRIRHEYDAAGERIRSLRDIDEAEGSKAATALVPMPSWPKTAMAVRIARRSSLSSIWVGLSAPTARPSVGRSWRSGSLQRYRTIFSELITLTG